MAFSFFALPVLPLRFESWFNVGWNNAKNIISFAKDIAWCGHFTFSDASMWQEPVYLAPASTLKTSVNEWPEVLLALQFTHVILLTPEWMAKTSHTLSVFPTLEVCARWSADSSKSHQYFQHKPLLWWAHWRECFWPLLLSFAFEVFCGIKWHWTQDLPGSAQFLLQCSLQGVAEGYNPTEEWRY